jgi:hypothetical protein
MPVSVYALGFTSYGLYVGHAAAVVVGVDLVLTANDLLAAAMFGLAGLGVIMSRGARSLVIRSFGEVDAARRRAALCAILSLLAYGSLAVFVAAVGMGWLDALPLDAVWKGIKGGVARWEGVSLREFRRTPDPYLTIATYHYETWRALGLGLFGCACGGVIEAALVLAVSATLGKGSDGQAET